jgi:signal transduction histidine kinase
MAKRLVERQHGTISVASTAGKGAVFTVRLPLDAGLAHARARAGADVSSA